MDRNQLNLRYDYSNIDVAIKVLYDTLEHPVRIEKNEFACSCKKVKTGINFDSS